MTAVLSTRPMIVKPISKVCLTVTNTDAYITKIGWPYSVVVSYPTVKECIKHIESQGWECEFVFID